MPLSRRKYVNTLRSQVGIHEGRDKNGNWNNHQPYSPATPGLEWSQNQAWCHTFASWGAYYCGGKEIIPITASCYTGVQWFRSRKQWTEYPVLGGLFYMGSTGQDHVGVVYAYDENSIYTVEGNTNSGGSYQGDGVYLRVRPRRGAGSPYGYGIPAFVEETISADPRHGGTPRASVLVDDPPPAEPTKPVVSVAHIEAARKRDPKLPQGGTTWAAEVNVVEQALAHEGLLDRRYATDGSFGSLTVEAYDAFRRNVGYTGTAAKGSIGKESLTKLGNRQGFRVVA
jgi:hypothetical protein